LKLGDTGLAVRQLQVALTRHGLRLEADGMFGRRTERAVRQFQRIHGLLADGIADEKMRGMLAARSAPARSAITNRLLATFKSLFKTA
jgi:peptidoglycan hydrolase-like protein with peptidoglycan-binding domain